MTKTKKTIITIAVITVLIAGSLVALRFAENIDPGTEPAAPPPETVYVLGGAVSESPPPLTVEVKNAHGVFTVVNTNPHAQVTRHDFTIQGFEGLPLQNHLINTIADRASSMTATQIISEGDANPADFGLNSPAATMTARYLDGSSAVLHFGAAAPGGGGVYVMREGSPLIYLIFQSMADNFLRRDLDLVRLDITEPPSDMPQITRAVLGGSVRPAPIVIEEVTDSQTESPAAGGRALMGTHRITSPVEARLHYDRGLEMLASSYALTANSVEARFNSPGELSKWGLDNPHSTLQIESTENESFTLLCSAQDSESMVYLIREGLPFVYRIPADFLPWLELDTFDMMDRLLILPFIDTVSVLEIRTPQRILSVELRGEGNDLEVFVGGIPYTAAQDVESVRNFRTLYTDCLSASYHAYSEEPLPANPRILLQIIYHYRDSTPPDTVTFYEGAARRVFVQLNDESPMLALSSFVDHLNRSVESFIAGERVRAFM